MHLINVLAAVLIIMVLMSSALLLFGPWSPLHRDYIGTTTPKETFGASRKVGSLEMSLKITSGPYFLNELLEVDLVVTNPTRTSYQLAPTLNGDPHCSSPLNIVTTGGGSPHALDFHHYWAGLLGPSSNCSPLSSSMDPLGTWVFAHQTFTNKSYVQLTSSGHVTLTAKLVSLRVSTQTGSGIFAGALDDTLQLLVSPHVPSDRQLSMKEQKAQVVISGPPAVTGHLIVGIGSVCPGPGGGKEIGGPGQTSGTTVVVKPELNGCSGPLWWAYVVGAPGYFLVAGKVNG